MENLTLETFKLTASKYRYESEGIGNLLCSGYGGYNSHMSQHNVHKLFIHSIITFCNDENLKNFLKNDLIKLTSEDFKEAFNWKKLAFGQYPFSILSLLSNNDLSNTAVQFILLYSWRMMDIGIGKKEGHIDIIGFLFNQNIKFNEKIANALLSLDYVDYFNPNEHRKEIFDKMIIKI